MTRNFAMILLVFASFFSSINAQIVAEHGFLPGKKIQFYPTLHSYNLSKSKFRIEVFDHRDSLRLQKINCSNIELTNTSEFANSDCINILTKYIDTLFSQSNAIIDSSSTDTIKVYLEAIDSRLIGFVNIRAHGLCQLRIKHQNIIKAYCTDITDADKNSPISKNALVTRKTATRIIGSAAMRETLEQFLMDLTTK